MTLYQKIKEIAKGQGISINQLEKDIGIQRGGMCKWDTHVPSVKKVKAVASALGVEIKDLVDDADNI